MGPLHLSFPWDAVLHEKTAPAWVAHGVTGSARRPVLAWASQRVTAS